MVATGQKIKSQRERTRLTTGKVAGMMKITVARYEAIERGANFTVIELVKIASILKVDPKQLLA